MAITSVPAAGITPAPTKQALQENYIDFANAGANSANWAQQYLPDLMEKEAEVFGNRTISGFLSQVGAEESMSADQVIWSEQGRLHLSYKVVALTAAAKVGTLTFTASTDADGKAMTGANHGVRAGDMILVADADSTTRCYVTEVAATGICTILRFDDANMASGSLAAGDVSILVFGSNYAKGSIGRAGANKPQFTSRTNRPIILKDKYEVSGSDASAIGWVEVSGEEGQNGYMWYLKASGDTKARFSDYLEMSMMESEKTAAAGIVMPTAAGGGKVQGTEGLWEALETRGNITNAFDGTGALLAEFDLMLAELDKNGAIEENMMFLNRDQSLQIDDMLGGQINTAAGNSYGVFNNDADMALNLGFSGFRRGSYDFYKTDWKYLNDSATRGNVGSTNAYRTAGMIVPAGTSSVYDQAMGKNIRRPFLHVRYRAAGMEDRRFKTWTTGSVGAATSDLDAMEMHFLSERCLVTQGANNFCLLESNLSS